MYKWATNQDWSDAFQLELCLEYINNQCNPEGFEEFLAERVRLDKLEIDWDNLPEGWFAG